MSQFVYETEIVLPLNRREKNDEASADVACPTGTLLHRKSSSPSIIEGKDTEKISGNRLKLRSERDEENGYK